MKALKNMGESRFYYCMSKGVQMDGCDHRVAVGRKWSV